MPTRQKYFCEPLYEERYRRVFRTRPAQPVFELFIPREFRTSELLDTVRAPIWQLEHDVIWPLMARLIKDGEVRGDLVEFGVYGGGSFRRHIELFRPTGMITRFYGFDSFQGLPKGNPTRDVPYFMQEGAFADSSVERVEGCLRQKFNDLSDVELVAGWFADTLPMMNDKISKIAFVRVDCDMYHSSVEVFNFLTGRLQHGAIIYFDDWTHEATTGETGAFFEFAERQEQRYRFERLLTVSDGALAVRVFEKQREL